MAYHRMLVAADTGDTLAGLEIASGGFELQRDGWPDEWPPWRRIVEAD